MVRGRSLNPPVTFVVSGQWPNAKLGGPRVVEYAQVLAQRLSDALGSRGIREVARAADLSHSTILAVLAGERWADMVTIAKLEETLRVALWPGPELRSASSK